MAFRRRRGVGRAVIALAVILVVVVGLFTIGFLSGAKAPSTSSQITTVESTSNSALSSQSQGNSVLSSSSAASTTPTTTPGVQAQSPFGIQVSKTFAMEVNSSTYLYGFVVNPVSVNFGMLNSSFPGFSLGFCSSPSVLDMDNCGSGISSNLLASYFEGSWSGVPTFSVKTASGQTLANVNGYPSLDIYNSGGLGNTSAGFAIITFQSSAPIVPAVLTYSCTAVMNEAFTLCYAGSQLAQVLSQGYQVGNLTASTSSFPSTTWINILDNSDFNSPILNSTTTAKSSNGVTWSYNTELATTGNGTGTAAANAVMAMVPSTWSIYGAQSTQGLSFSSGEAATNNPNSANGCFVGAVCFVTQGSLTLTVEISISPTTGGCGSITCTVIGHVTSYALASSTLGAGFAITSFSKPLPVSFSVCAESTLCSGIANVFSVTISVPNTAIPIFYNLQFNSTIGG